MNDQILAILKTWASPVLTLLTGLLVGWFFKRHIHKHLAKLVDKTAWRGDDVILKAIKSHIVLWFFLAAFYVASNSIQIAAPYNEYVAKIVLSVLIISITIAVSKILVGLLILWSEQQHKGFPSTAMFINLVRITVYIVGALIILDSLDISITPMLTALGVGGLAISLALKDTLADLFSGLHILLSQKVKPGDFVELDSGEMGYVTNITWRNTSLLERSNNVISIPNSRLSTAITRNYDSQKSDFIVKVPVGVSYDSDLDHVEKVTLEVAQSVVNDVDGAVKDFQPVLRFKAFGASSIDFIVHFRGKKYGDQHPIVDTFIRRLHKRYNKEGIEIPFPIRTLVYKNQKPEKENES